jgi:hypothetical protein
VVGDLAKGEFLGSEISAGPHVITLDPYPYYRAVNLNESIVGIRTRIYIIGEPSQPIYIEVSACTGHGKIEMRAKERDAVSGLQAIRDMKSAW